MTFLHDRWCADRGATDCQICGRHRESRDHDAAPLPLATIQPRSQISPWVHRYCRWIDNLITREASIWLMLVALFGLLFVVVPSALLVWSWRGSYRVE